MKLGWPLNHPSESIRKLDPASKHTHTHQTSSLHLNVDMCVFVGDGTAPPDKLSLSDSLSISSTDDVPDFHDSGSGTVSKIARCKFSGFSFRLPQTYNTVCRRKLRQPGKDRGGHTCGAGVRPLRMASPARSAVAWRSLPPTGLGFRGRK